MKITSLILTAVLSFSINASNVDDLYAQALEAYEAQDIQRLDEIGSKLLTHRNDCYAQKGASECLNVHNLMVEINVTLMEKLKIDKMLSEPAKTEEESKIIISNIRNQLESKKDNKTKLYKLAKEASFKLVIMHENQVQNLRILIREIFERIDSL